MQSASHPAPRAPLVASTEYGDPDRPPIVFLHGFAGNQSSWREWIGDFARDHRVFTLDLKGFGEAPKPRDGRYAPSDHAVEVARFLAARDLTDVTLVGHSLGGGVALLVALAELEAPTPRLSRLAVLAGPAFPQKIPPFISMARVPLLGPVALHLIPPRRIIAAALRSIVYDPSRVTEQQITNYAEPLGGPGGRYGLLHTARQLVPEDLDLVVDRYPLLGLPTLLLWGRQDRVVPLGVAQRLRDLLPDARLVVLDPCGHLLPEEESAKGVSALRSFLEATENAQPRP